MTWPLTTADETSVLAVTAPPTDFQVAPGSLEKITPAAGPSIPKLENCPKPARMLLGLLGSRAIPPMDREVRWSVRGVQVPPPLVVFQMPPFTAPAYMVLLSLGSTSRDWTAPTTGLLGTITASPPNMGLGPWACQVTADASPPRKNQGDQNENENSREICSPGFSGKTETRCFPYHTIFPVNVFDPVKIILLTCSMDYTRI